MTDPRILKVRMRLLVAAGATFLVGRVATAHAEPGASGSGEVPDAPTVDEAGTGVGPADPPQPDEAKAAEAKAIKTAPDPKPGPECTGCYGRPYLAGGEVRRAAIVDTDGWLRPGSHPRPRLDGLDAPTREALVAFWTDAATAEHSSVAGFHRFALDLLAHGAPADLVAAAQRAAADELRHARACFSLASAYAGRSIGPGPMPLGPSAPVAATWVELAAWTVHEGCVGETVAAWLATEIAGSATDPAVRAVMEAIAADELRHAELAWSVVRWASAEGGAPVRAAIADAFARASISAPASFGAVCPAHGLLDGSATTAAMQRALHDLVRPCAAALLAA
jgi:hypothetical protein